ncbi:MAG: TraR/DksA family transcriptional regulator [bacterium]
MLDFIKALLNKKGANMVAPTKKKRKKMPQKAAKSQKQKISVKSKKTKVAKKVHAVKMEKTFRKESIQMPEAEVTVKKRSVKDFEQIKKMLLKMKAEIMDELARKKAALEEEKSIEIEEGDAIAEDRNREYEYLLTTMETKKLKQINEALAKIEDGTYGICEECGEEIPLARLKILPFTKLCVDCASNVEKEEALKQSLESEKDIFAAGNNEEGTDVE